MTISDLPSSLSRPTAAHCAAVFFGSLANLVLKGSDQYREGQGTLTFLSYRGRLLGLTNRHVTHAGDTDRGAAGAVFLVALDKHSPLAGRLLDLPSSLDGFDLSVYLLPSDFLSASDKRAIDLGGALAPPLRSGDMCLAVGFPAMLRHPVDHQQMSHGLFHVLSTCQAVTDRTIVAHDVVPGPHVPYEFGGISGGPLFSLDGERYHFRGIVHAGRGYGDGAPDNEIWIYAHPVNAATIEEIFELNGMTQG